MKRLVLSLTMSALVAPVFAQELTSSESSHISNLEPAVSHQRSAINPLGAYKTSGVTDTFTLAHDSQINGTARVLYADYAAPLDSGALYGTNAHNYKGFAQHYFADYDVSGNNDTSTQVLGFFSKWGGNIQTASTKNVILSVWKRGTNKIAVASRPKFYVYGTPSALFTGGTKSVPANTLNVNGTPTLSYLAAPLTVTENIYVGYTIAYTYAAADSVLGLRSTIATLGNTYTIETATGDTLVTANNLIQTNAGTWTSVRYTLGITNGGDQIIAPLVRVSCPKCGVGVGGFKSTNLSFFGNYPNPVITNTNVKFAVKKSTTVSLTIYDQSGRTIKVMNLGHNTAGEHVATISADGLAAGNYVYTLETTDGDLIAAQMTVTK